mgnify:CR=1 FL=1
MYNGIILSDGPPAHVTGYAWCKVFPDNSKEWYHFNKDTQSWVLDLTEPAPALIDHSHPTHGDINFTGTVSADGDEGLTGQKTIAGYTFTFKKGLLVGFQAP